MSEDALDVERNAAESPKLTPAEMKQALAAEQQGRIAAAAEEIKATCEKYKVQIVPKAELTQGTVTMSLQIVSTE